MQEKQTDEAKEAGTGLAGTGGDQVEVGGRGPGVTRRLSRSE